MRDVERFRSLIIIGGDRRDSGSAGTHEHRARHTDELLAEVPLGGRAEIEEAVAAARTARADWDLLGPQGRRDCLYRLAQLIEEMSADLEVTGRLDTGVAGKGWRWRHAQAVDWIKVYAGYADKVEGSLTAAGTDGTLEYQIPQPYGVVGIVITWNAPLISLAMKVPAALAAGNTVVIKPSELNPYTPTLFVEACLRSGIPEGVVNLVTGGREAGEALTTHADVAKVSFTGGNAAAAEMVRATADQFKPFCLELGGKSPYLVFEDADLDATLDRVVGDLGNAGQSCRFGSRLLVHETIADAFATGLVDRVRELKVGDPGDPATDMGPLISRASQARVIALVEKSRTLPGVELLTGGGIPALEDDLSGGYFVEPTVLRVADTSSPVMQQEIFGPVFCIASFGTEEEAVAMANSTPYGLGAFIHTSDLRRAHRVARRVDAGTVYVNNADRRNGNAPFGGFGSSGYGREGGRAGLDEFIQIKTVGIA